VPLVLFEKQTNQVYTDQMRFVFLLLGTLSLIAAPPDPRLKPASEAAAPDAMNLLATLVNIDSGTGDAEGAAKVEAILIARLKALGAEVRIVPAEEPGLGDNVVATFRGTGHGGILIVSHVDTVFSPGTAAVRPFSLEGTRAHGPGVADEKGGDVCAIEALTILHGIGFQDFDRITLLLDSSEEIGSSGARALITSLSKQHDVEFNMEPGREGTAANGSMSSPDALTVWRKGSANVEITVHGRAAHSGNAPQNGRNAAVELIHQLSAIEAAFPHTGNGTTVNLTVMKSGERTNIIPDLATAVLNVRYRKAADFDDVLTRIEAISRNTQVPDTTVSVTHKPAFPPFFEDARGDALTAMAQSIYAELGRKLDVAGSGGSSESALAQAAGIPAVDGLGFDGGDFHTDHEWMDASAVAPRIYLLARLIQTLGARP
jgi:glutamate carboxypeptidase